MVRLTGKKSFHFNSIKVRLKHDFNTSLSVPSRFQFHKGTIKTQVTTTADTLSSKFQFHKGTIKTQLADLLSQILQNFNSIKVRLKRQAGSVPRFLHVFQFHKGTIKTGAQQLGSAISKFQFHKGTIKTKHTFHMPVYSSISIP